MKKPNVGKYTSLGWSKYARQIGSFPQVSRGENKKYSKPPPRYHAWILWEGYLGKLSSEHLNPPCAASVAKVSAVPVAKSGHLPWNCRAWNECSLPGQVGSINSWFSLVVWGPVVWILKGSPTNCYLRAPLESQTTNLPLVDSTQFKNTSQIGSVGPSPQVEWK